MQVLRILKHVNNTSTEYSATMFPGSSIFKEPELEPEPEPKEPVFQKELKKPVLRTGFNIFFENHIFSKKCTANELSFVYGMKMHRTVKRKMENIIDFSPSLNVFELCQSKSNFDSLISISGSTGS